MHVFFETFFRNLSFVDTTLWGYIGVPTIIVFGLYFSFKARWLQLRRFTSICKLFFISLNSRHEQVQGVSSIKAFFASIAGCISIGNIIGVCAAVNIGGPGALVWMWIASLLGMVVKYSEIYLGISFRVKNHQGGYDGGPMYYLRHVDPSGFLSKAFCVALCIYGVEVYMFRMVTHTIVETWGWNRIVVVICLLALVFWTTAKGIESVGRVSSFVIPLFLFTFTGVSFWFFFKNSHLLISTFKLIFSSAFTGHAAMGAFAGSGLMLTIAQGMKRACYSADIGVGCASVIMSEADGEIIPEKQAAMAGIFSTFIDTFVVSTISFLLVSVSGLWNQGIHESRMVSTALSGYIPHITLVWPIFIFLLGFSSIISYFSAGGKAAKFLWASKGQYVYKLYAVCAFLLFSFIGSEEHIMTIMSTCGITLLLINLYGIFKLRSSISFTLEPHQDQSKKA